MDNTPQTILSSNNPIKKHSSLFDINVNKQQQSTNYIRFSNNLTRNSEAIPKISTAFTPERKSYCSNDRNEFQTPKIENASYQKPVFYTNNNFDESAQEFSVITSNTALNNQKTNCVSKSESTILVSIVVKSVS